MTSRQGEWARLGGAFLGLVLVATVWLALDRTPPEWDHANHLQRALECGREVQAGDLESVMARSSFYPPVVPCLAGVIARVVPSDIAAAQGVVLAFLGVGMVSIYLIGRERISGRAGVLAAVLFGAAPFVVFNSVRFQLDLPLAAIVPLALWLLIRTDGFTRPLASLALGVVSGVGMLVKPPFFVYVLPSIVWVLVRERRGAGRARNVALAVVAAVVASIAWYGPRLMGLPAQIGARSFQQAAESGHPPALSLSGLAIYPVTLPMFFGVAASGLFAFGLLVAARQGRGWELVSVLVPFALFLAIQNKNARYTLPILPMASLVAALALERLRSRARTIALAVTAVIVLLQVSATAFALPSRAGIDGTRLAGAIPAPPRAADWQHERLLAAIARHAGTSGATVSVVPNHMWFSPANFRYYAVRDAQPLRIVRAWDDVPVGVDYMIVKTGDVGPPWTEGKSRRAAARLDEPDFARAFPVIAEAALPDGSTATVRARAMGRGIDADPAAVAAAVERAVTASLADVASGVEGLSVRVSYDGDAIVRGLVRRLEISADRATVGERRRRGASMLAVRDLRIVADDVVVNPWLAVAAGRFEPLDARRVKLLHATIEHDALRAFLAETKGFSDMRVRLEPETLAFHIALPGPDVSGRVRVRPAPGRPFTLDADEVRVGGVPVPAPLVHWVFRNFDPSTRLASRLPVPVEIAGVRIAADAIRIAD
jgi:hypothetical protein